MKNRFENTFREDDAKQDLFGKPKVNKGKKLLDSQMRIERKPSTKRKALDNDERREITGLGIQLEIEVDGTEASAFIRKLKELEKEGIIESFEPRSTEADFHETEEDDYEEVFYIDIDLKTSDPNSLSRRSIERTINNFISKQDYSRIEFSESILIDYWNDTKEVSLDLFMNMIESNKMNDEGDRDPNSWMYEEYEEELEREYEDDKHENSWMSEEYKRSLKEDEDKLNDSSDGLVEYKGRKHKALDNEKRLSEVRIDIGIARGTDVRSARHAGFEYEDFENRDDAYRRVEELKNDSDVQQVIVTSVFTRK